MARRTKEALDFLDALTEYIAWRGRGRQPAKFAVGKHVRLFGRYLVSCGVKRRTPLHNSLVEFMAAMERAGDPPVERVPPT